MPAVPQETNMSASVASDVWPATTWENEAPTEHDFDGIRGLLYSIAISLVFVWAPIGFIVFGTALLIQ